MVGPFSKPIKITALTRMIPTRNRKKDDSKHKNFHSLPQISPEQLILEEQVDNFYIVPKTEVPNVISQQDLGDWKHLLKRFDSVLGNLMRLLNNLRKQLYYKTTFTKLEEKEIERRHNSLKEKLLEKTDSETEITAKTSLSEKEKIDKLKDVLSALGFTAAGMAATGMPPPGAELDAATLAQVRASGADMIAAAHLATLEASSPQHVADVMQVILNRARGQSGGIPAVITAYEQFTPYSAAIYGASPGDPAAARKYGHLKVSKAEIFQLASQPNGLESLTRRFNAGNPGVAAQVLTDIRSNGPLITSSRQFVGGAQYFTGYPKSGARRRPDGGNYFRDRYAAGAIFLPDLFHAHQIQYDTISKPNLISSFIVDKPTIYNLKSFNEPLIIIPLRRPIGLSILNMIFREPFQKIENIFKKDNQEPSQTEQKTNQPTPYNTNRFPILSNKSQIGSTSPSVINHSDTNAKSDINSNEMQKSNFEINDIYNTLTNFNDEITIPSLVDAKKTNIDRISQTTDDVFGLDVYIATQTITVIPE